MSSPRPPLARAESRTSQVARNIRTDIEAGVLRDGQVLPSTRELASQWGVSVFTINEAMKVLVEEGLVVTSSRSKRVVRAPQQASRTEVRPVRPHILLIGGYAGSGKSELGRILVRETGWPMLDKDTLTRSVVETALEIAGQPAHDRESETYLSLIRPREYECLAAATSENVECGNSAIVTAPFIREFNDPAWIKRTLAIHANMNAATTFVWVYCDLDTMHSYLRYRRAPRDAGKLSAWMDYVASIDVDFRPATEHIVVDNSASSRPLQAQAKILLDGVLSRGEQA